MSRLFTVTKKSGGLRPVINLKPLNQFLHLQTSKMEVLSDLKVLLEPSDFMITINLSDTCMTLPIEEESRNYQCFQFQDQMFQFCVLPFGLNDAPRAFTKTLKPPVGTLRSLGFKLVVFLDDIILAASTRELLYLPGSDSYENFRKPGFCYKSGKIKSGTFSSGLFSRLYCGLKENVLFTSRFKDSIDQSECPDSVESTKGFVTKTKAVYWNVQCFKNCNPRSTASVQIDPNQLTSTLRSQPITQQNYDVKICLNSQSRKDLTWWVKNLKANCSRPIHPPPVDLKLCQMPQI